MFIDMESEYEKLLQAHKRKLDEKHNEYVLQQQQEQQQQQPQGNPNLIFLHY
jgi:hypothetical protein